MGLDSGKDRPDPGMAGGITCPRPEMHRCKKRAEEDDAKTGKAFIYLFQTVALRLAAFSVLVDISTISFAARIPQERTLKKTEDLAI